MHRFGSRGFTLRISLETAELGQRRGWVEVSILLNAVELKGSNTRLGRAAGHVAPWVAEMPCLPVAHRHSLAFDGAPWVGHHEWGTQKSENDSEVGARIENNLI